MTFEQSRPETPVCSSVFVLLQRIYASVEESLVGDSSGHCTLHLRGLDIKNVEPGLIGLGRSDPFYVISRKCADHAAGVVRW